MLSSIAEMSRRAQTGGGYSVPEPRIDRDIELHFQGDWGQANLHRLCGWLMQETMDRVGRGSRIAVWGGRGGTDAVEAVADRKVDMAFAVPAVSVRMALDGTGMYSGKPFPGLRAIGTMPQTDRLIFALRRDLGIDSFAALRDRKQPLKIATSQDDGVNTIGFAAQRAMELAGIPRSTLESWGGGYLEWERPPDCIAAVLDGRADAIIHEAIMTSWWQDLAEAVDLQFLSFEPTVIEGMESAYRWSGATVAAGYLRGLDTELTALEFSDFLAVTRDDLPDDVAYLIAWAMCETRSAIEAQYLHIPPERSPLTYPLDPVKIAQTAIPLHPGAQRYYRDAGVL